MRVALFALMALASTVSAQFIVTPKDTTVWLVSNATVAATVENGPMNNVVVGQPMTITLTTSETHPFAFTQTLGGEAVDVKPTLSAGCANGTSALTYVGSAGCILTVTPPADLLAGQATGSIFYKCNKHTGMVGRINLVAAAAGTTAPPSGTTAPPSGTTAPPSGTTAPPSGTTAPPSGTTAPPAGTTPPPSGTTTAPPTVSDPTKYYITGATAANDAYTVAVGLPTAAAQQDPEVNVAVGTTISIIISAVLPLHPFGFSNQNVNKSVDTTLKPTTVGAGCTAGTGDALNTWTTTSVTNPCVLTITIPATAPAATYYYKCANHFAMLGRINVNRPSSATATVVLSVATTVLAAITAIIVA